MVAKQTRCPIRFRALRKEFICHSADLSQDIETLFYLQVRGVAATAAYPSQLFADPQSDLEAASAHR